MSSLLISEYGYFVSPSTDNYTHKLNEQIQSCDKPLDLSALIL